MVHQKLIAFWKYDIFPYCLWGEIDHFSKHRHFIGMVSIKEYGGQLFKPFLICTEDQSECLIGDLKKLTQQHVNKQSDTKDEFDALIYKLWENTSRLI